MVLTTFYQRLHTLTVFLLICFEQICLCHSHLIHANCRHHPWYPSCKFMKKRVKIWCDFDRASSLICGNKMPTRRNRGFYCRSYCLLNMFRGPLCPSSGAQEYYTVVAACGISCCGFQVAGLVWCCSIQQTGHKTLSSTPDQQLEKPQHEIPQPATTV